MDCLQKGKRARMLIICNQPQSAQTLEKILSHYFPKNQTGHLNLITKYYSASIEINHQSWPSLNSLLSEHNFSNPNDIFELPSKPQEKQDLLIMMAASHESYPAQLYDLIIHKYNPDNLLLMIDTKHKEVKWIDEEIIGSQVNNFIEVVKEDIEKFAENLPERTKSGLLQENNDEWCIFDLLELMETTQWSLMNRIDLERPKKIQETEKKTIEKDQKEPLPKVERKDNQNSSQEEPPEQISEQQLEQQMMNFEAIMSEMMNMKNAGGQGQPVPHEQRKKTAEDIINKLLQGSFM